MRRRLADLVSGLALLALSGWMFSCAVEVASYRPRLRPVTLSVELSFVRQVEWQHSATFWFALGSVTLVLGLVALLLGATTRRALAR